MAQAEVVQPRGVTHGQMRHREPAFHEELDLLMSSESGSGISHTGDGWTRARAPSREPGDTRQGGRVCLCLRQPWGNWCTGRSACCLLPVSTGWVPPRWLRAAAAVRRALGSAQKLGSCPQVPAAPCVQVPSGPSSSRTAPRVTAAPLLGAKSCCATFSVTQELCCPARVFVGGEADQSHVTNQPVALCCAPGPCSAPSTCWGGQDPPRPWTPCQRCPSSSTRQIFCPPGLQHGREGAWQRVLPCAPPVRG